MYRTARKTWIDYFTNVDGVVFLVDALDRGRFAEVKIELDVRTAYAAHHACWGISLPCDSHALRPTACVTRCCDAVA